MAFSKILGHDQAIHIIVQALLNQRVAHAYLFSGPDSIGKRRTALEFAKALNCTGSQPGDACDVCASCRKIERGIHPDLFQIEPQRTSPTARDTVIKIEDIRNLQGKLGFHPYEGRYKVVILEGAEKMNPQAGNAFLKTLEEPPSDTVLLLLTANIQSLMPTLLSRCQTLRFSPLADDDLREILRGQPDLDIPPDELDLRISRSRGQVARALEPDLVEAARYRDELLALVDRVSFDDIDLVFAWTRKVSRDTARVGLILQELLGLLRDLACLRCGAVRGHLLNPDLEAELRKLSVRQTAPGWVRWMDSVLRAQGALTGNANVQLALDNMLMDFCEAA